MLVFFLENYKRGVVWMHSYTLDNVFANIESKLSKVVDKMAERALSLLKEIIEKEVYEPRVPMASKSGNPVYQRTYDFLNSAWFVTKVKKTMMEFTSTLYFDGSKMTYNPSKWQHGNSHIDRRKDMADILSNYMKNMEESDWGGALNIQTEYDYWQEFQYFLYQQIPYWFEEECRKVGLPVKKGGM